MIKTCSNCGSLVTKQYCKGNYPDTICENWQPRTCLNCGAPVTKLYCEDHYPDDICEKWQAKKPPSNFDRIQNDSVEELAAFLCTVSSCGSCIASEYCRGGHPGYIDWLKEVAEI